MNPYIRITRIDHWFKNIFFLPGYFLALALTHTFSPLISPHFAIAIFSLCIASSANYTLNEYLDAPFDAYHPAKKYRAGAQGEINGVIVTLLYLMLFSTSLWLSLMIGKYFFLTLLAFLIMGILYNTPPIRLKEHVYIDVLAESMNNPLRFLLGWYTLTNMSFPPSSILISYWMGGAFLMTIKRFSEYRRINDAALAMKYRRSFQHYTEESLLLIAIFYALMSSFFLAIFLIKYKIELLLSFPLFALLFVWYTKIGMKPNSSTQSPENLYKTETFFIAYVLFLCLFVCGLLFIKIEGLQLFLRATTFA